MAHSKRKRILIEIAHPSQVHQFKYIAWELEKRDYEVLFVVQEKEFTSYLLNHYGFQYRVIGRSKRGLLRKVFQVPQLYFRMFMLLITNRPSLFLSRSTLHGSHLTWILRIPHIIFADTEHVKLMLALTTPFVKTKVTPHSFNASLGRNHFRYQGNIEMFYLHPTRFQADPGIFTLLGIPENTPYAIIRFVSWSAHHDNNQQGFTAEEKLKTVRMLEQKMRVFISSEGDLPEELKEYKISVPPERIHDALAFATLYVGEGATMASEAALLGTPSVYVNTLTAGILEDAARAGLIYSFRSIDGVEEKLTELLADTELRSKHKKLSSEYVAGMVDISGFIIWVIETYPHCLKGLRVNPVINMSSQKLIVDSVGEIQ